MRAVFALAFCLFAFGPPRFEVASIKPSTQQPGSSGMHTGNGRLTAENVTLRRCIQGAYAVSPNLIFGGPNWLDKDRFQIDAKTIDPANGDSARFHPPSGAPNADTRTTSFRSPTGSGPAPGVAPTICGTGTLPITRERKG